METKFTMIRDIVRQMDPELRALWAKAIAYEEAERTQGKRTQQAYYAWNRVHGAVLEAVECEKACRAKEEAKRG